MADNKYDKAIGALYASMRKFEKEGKTAQAAAIRNRIAYLEQLKQTQALQSAQAQPQQKSQAKASAPVKEKIPTEHHYGRIATAGVVVVLVIFAIDIFTNALSLPYVQQYLSPVKSAVSAAWPQVEYQFCVFSSQAGVLFNPSTVNTASIASAKCAKQYLQQSAQELGCVDCYTITGALQRNSVIAGGQAPLTITVQGTDPQYCDSSNSCYVTPPALQPSNNVPWFELDAGTFNTSLYGRCVDTNCATINATDSFTVQGVITTDCSASEVTPTAFLAYNYQTTGKSYVNIRTSDSDPQPSSSLPTTTPGPVQVNVVPDAAYFDSRYDTSGMGVTIRFNDAGVGTAYLKTLTLHEIAPLGEQPLSITGYQPQSFFSSAPQFDIPIDLSTIPALTPDSASNAVFITLDMPTLSHYSTYILSADLTYQYFYQTTLGGLLVDTSAQSCFSSSGSTTQVVISGHVTNGPLQPIDGATVVASNQTSSGSYQGVGQATTNSEGYYSIQLSPGNYLLTAAKGCDSTNIQYIGVSKSTAAYTNTTQDFQLTPQAC